MRRVTRDAGCQFLRTFSMYMRCVRDTACEYHASTHMATVSLAYELSTASRFTLYAVVSAYSFLASPTSSLSTLLFLGTKFTSILLCTHKQAAPVARRVMHPGLNTSATHSAKIKYIRIIRWSSPKHTRRNLAAVKL